MKTTRKLMALLMVVAILFAMAVAASAETPTGTITIQNQQTGSTYDVYRMFNWVETANGNYWYQINNEWKDFNKVGENQEFYFDLDENDFLIKIQNGQTDATIATAAKTYANGKTTVNITEKVPYGYYLMVSSLGTNVAMGTLNSEDGLTLREKNTATGLPTIEKTIENATQEFKVGDTINYKIEIACDEGDRTYTIHDIMKGSTLNDHMVVDIAGMDTPQYEVTLTKDNLNDDCTFHVTIALKDGTPSFQAYQQITITYSATVNESAATEGLSNKAFFDGENGDSDEEVVEKAEYTVKKVIAGTDTVLQGAEFELYVLNGTESAPVLVPVVAIDSNSDGIVDYYRPAADGVTGVAIVAGEATIKMLEKGKTYVLQETKAPVGYQALTEPVSAEGNAFVVENAPLSALPQTGGVGTTMFYIIGTALVLGAVVLLVTKKRMAAK